MRGSMRLVCAYIRFYKKQTFTLFLGVLLSSALLAGMGGLLGSGKHAALQQAYKEYGGWHYCVNGDRRLAAESEKYQDRAGYRLEGTGSILIREELKNPLPMRLVSADDAYLRMMGYEILEGHYPQNPQEAAMDHQMIHSLGINPEIGTKVMLGQDTYTLCGVLSDPPEKFSQVMWDDPVVFTGGLSNNGNVNGFVFLKFDENRSIYHQMDRFCRRFGIERSGIRRNNGVVDFLDLQPPGWILDIIRTGITEPQAGLPYIWAMLNVEGKLTQTAMLAVFAVFGAFIVYSLFRISVVRRMSQYSMMQAIGLTDGGVCAVLLLELGMICLAGYPVGCLAGNFFAYHIYQNAGRIFVAQKQSFHTGSSDQLRQSMAGSLPDAGDYQIGWRIMLYGAVFMAVVVVWISVRLLRRMQRLSIRQMMAQNTKKHVNRRIYSTCRSDMAGVLAKKFMYDRKGTFMGILLSLSVGSVIFLGAFYVTENTKIHNALTFKADDGLGSDIQVLKCSEELTDLIPQESVAQMTKIPGIQSIHPVRYLLGEIPLENGRLVWTEYFAEIANNPANPPDPELLEKYHGIAVQTGDHDYTLKVNIYGYDDEMLQEMGDYLLEGSVDPDQMRRENSVIFKTIMDGQGTYEGIDLHAGETIRLKTPDLLKEDLSKKALLKEALRFQGDSSWYQNLDLKVAAVASRPLAKVDTFIGDPGDSVVDLIMTNEQMEKNFGVTDYRTLSISLQQSSDADQVSAALGKLTASLGSCAVKDYTGQIRMQNQYLSQKMFFYYGIAAVLLGISLLHIMNSMQYLVCARKREFGILRAMGITDAGFRRMLAKEGLRYGISSSLVVFGFYLIVQKILYYFMVRVYRYLHPKWCISWQALAGVAVVDVLLCAGVTLAAGQQILREQILEEIRE